MVDASPAPLQTLPFQPRSTAAANEPFQTAEASASNKSFALPRNFKPAAVKLDNIERLEGQHNYEDWASQMALVFDAMGVYDIVESLELDSRASPSDHAGYQSLSKHALLILIQVISKSILKKVSKYRSPHGI